LNGTIIRGQQIKNLKKLLLFHVKTIHAFLQKQSQSKIFKIMQYLLFILAFINLQ